MFGRLFVIESRPCVCRGQPRLQIVNELLPEVCSTKEDAAVLTRVLVLSSLVAAFVTSGAHAESRVIVPISEATPRNGEGAMMALRDGSLLLIYTQWYGAKGHDHDPARLVAIRSKDGGATWSKPETVQENVGEMNVMSASLVRTASGKVLLTYIRIDSNRFANLWFKESTDECLTWSAPKQLSHGKDGLIFTVNHAAIRLKSGRIVLAAYGGPSAWQKDEHFRAYTYFTDDEGATWTKSSNEVDCPKRGAMEPMVAEVSDGRLVMLMRTQMTKLYRAYSKDRGATWSASEETDITHPEAPVHIIGRPDSTDLIMVWNNAVVPGAGHQGPRTPLTLGVSTDDGVSWTRIRNIEDDPKGSYCYVTSAFTKNTLHLAYYGIGGLRYQQIPLKTLGE